MPWDNAVAAANLSAAMQQPEIYTPIFQAAITQSAAMTLGTQLPPMSRLTRSMTIMNNLPMAYWVAKHGAGLKKTTNMQWKGKTLTAEEIAVIVPIAEDLLQDTANTGFDLWAEITPRIGERMGQLVDLAVFGGIDLPNTWLTDTSGTAAGLVPGAIAAGNSVPENTGADIYDAIFGEGGVIQKVEEDGFDVGGFVGSIGSKGKLRQQRPHREVGGGMSMFMQNADGTINIQGYTAMFPRNGAIDATGAHLLAGDWSNLVWATRQGIDVKLLTEATLTDQSGNVQFNLAQQDMVALRFTFRLAFQIANPVTYLEGTEAQRYPFAVLTPVGT